MFTQIETLASYVPNLITDRLRGNPDSIAAPLAERFPAAVLFADISGFTALTERLAQQGPLGAETLARALNSYFGQLIDLISAYSGDVLKFAGDGLTAMWPVEQKEKGGGAEDEVITSVFLPSSLLAATQRAAACALAIQATLQDYRTEAGTTLALRIGLAAGEVAVIHLGGIYGRWEFALTGPALIQVAQAETRAQPGQVVVSPEAWSLLGDQGIGRGLSDGYVHVEAIQAGVTATPRPPRILPPEIETPLRAYIPGGVLARLAAGQSGWLAELRRVTLLFINLPDLNYRTSLEQSQEAMQAIQATLYRYEGSLDKISVDEKGVTLVAALGLPPLAHEDDAERGVQVALAVRAALQVLDWRCAIGVTTGRAFCGSVGNDIRREYTMLGDVVNLAARLMQVASQELAARLPESPVGQAQVSGRILCDETTYQAAQYQIAFEVLPQILVKGKTKLVAIYRPLAVLPTPSLNRISAAGGQALGVEMVGRTGERVALADRLQALLRGSGSVVIIEGEAGIGKSRLIEDMLRQAQALNVRSLVGVGDAIEKSSPFHAWRPIFRQLFNLDALGDTNTIARRNQVMSMLPTMAELVNLVPLLNAVLPLGLQDNQVTRQMEGQVRADNTHELLTRLLQTVAAKSPTLLVLEDAHWLDSASWALAYSVNQRVQPLLLVLVTRPMGDSLPPEYNQLRHAAGTHHLQLEALPARETLRLVCQRLGVINLPEPVAQLINAKAEGHPFFSEELAYTLRDAGLIRVVDRECQLAPGVEHLNTLAIPDTIEEVITSRIDRLGPAQQLTLKVASVIGRVFPFATLQDIHPIEADKPRLPEYLHTLEKLDIARVKTIEPDLAYIFKHVITQEVAYNLMSFAQRQQLHQAVAEWLEHTYVDDLTPFFSLLAHHWSQTIGEQANPLLISQAINYLEQAGEQALRTYANQEAINFFNKALELDKKYQSGNSHQTNGHKQAQLPALHRPGGISLLRQARWERQLGQAYLQLSQFDESRRHLERALALLGRPMPTTAVGLWGTLGRQVLRQAWHRLWPQRWVRQAQPHPADNTTALLEAALAYESLGELLMFAQPERVTRLLVAAAALQAVNLAEQAGPSPELARAYSTIYMAAGLVPLPWLAELYRCRAVETAHSVNQLPALAWVSFIQGIYQVGIGQWDQAEAALHQSIKICQRLGDRYRGGQAQGILGKVAYYRGQFAQGAALAADLYAKTRQKNDLFAQALGLYQQGENKLRLGQTDEAITFLEAALLIYQENPDRLTYPIIYSLLAVARLRRNEPALALEAADTAARLLAQTAIDVFASFQAYAGVTEVYLGLWEGNDDGGYSPGTNMSSPSQVPILRSKAHQICKAYWKLARVYPIARPQGWLWQGLYEWLDHQPQRAQRVWQNSLAEAEHLAMPYEQGLAHYEIGRHVSRDESVRSMHLSRACEIFARLEAGYDLARAQHALELGDDKV